MIVTDTTLVGFTMINGTWGLQLALLIAALFNYFINPEPQIYATPAQVDELHFVRMFTIPFVHACLTIFNFVASSDKIPYDGVKQGLSFLGMIMYTYMILTASKCMIFYPYPLSDKSLDNAQMKASYLWLIIEQLVFISTLVSNVVFIMIRSCIRNKLQLDMIDEKRQLPNVDTIISISEVANAWNA